MTADGDHGVTELAGRAHGPFVFGGVLLGAEFLLIGIKIDGEGQQGFVVQHAVATERFDFVDHRLGAEAVGTFDGGLLQAAGEQWRAVVEIMLAEGIGLGGKALRGGQLDRRFIEGIEAIEIVCLGEEGDVAGVARQGAIDEQAVGVLVEVGSTSLP